MRQILIPFIYFILSFSIFGHFEQAVMNFSKQMSSSCHHGQTHAASHLLKITSQQIYENKPSINNLNILKTKLLKIKEDVSKELKQFDKGNVIHKVCFKNYLNYQSIAEDFITYIDDLKAWEYGLHVINRKRFKNAVQKSRSPANYKRKTLERVKRKLRHYQNKSNLPLTPVEMYQLMR